MSQVPTTNINALYSNTSTGTIISPTIMDSAVQDIVATINTNDAAATTHKTANPIDHPDASVTNSKIATGIDAVKLADGSVNNTEFQYINSLSSNAQTQLDAKVPLTQKGAANGVASLDSGAKVPIAQLPDAVVGALEYQGTWNASTNSPTLSSTPTTIKGYYYVVSVAGTQFTISFDVGDWIVSNGTIWQKIDNTDAVPSVFGRLGNVVAATNDYTWAQIDKTTSSLLDLATRSASDLNIGTLPVGRVPIGIPATSIGTGVVDNAHLAFLSDVTSLIQAQLNARAPLSHVGSYGAAQHAVADSLNAGFISPALNDKLIGLSTVGLVGYAVPVGQVLSLFARYSQEQDPATGEMVFYEI